MPSAVTPLPLPAGHPAAALFQVGAPGAPPCGIAGDASTVWIADFRRSRIVTIDAAADLIRERTNVNSGPCGLAYIDGALFVAEKTSTALYKRDAVSLEVLADPVFGRGTIWDVDASADAIWFVDRGLGQLVRVDPATNQATTHIELGGMASGLAVTPSAVWVAVEELNQTLRVDPATGAVTARLATGTQPIWVAATDAVVWVTHADGTAALIDAATNEVVTRLELGGQPGEPAISGDSVWIPNQEGGEVTELGLADGSQRRTLQIGPGVAQVVNAAGSLWISGYTDGLVWRLQP